jgi:TetR/AcrR family transcriptional regulator, regulator of cefoperazone and chloramphenicol sensitivity
MKMTAVSTPPIGNTEANLDAKTRLLLAAAELFAERGVAATSVREIVQAAKVNVAAVNYYFGSKENLYLEVLRYTFRQARSLEQEVEPLIQEARQIGTPAAAALAIRRYIQMFLQALFTVKEADRHLCLMARELADPSGTLDIIVEEFIIPKHRVLTALIGQFAPDLARQKNLIFYSISVIAQCLHYRWSLPVILKLTHQEQPNMAWVEQVATHIADFSLSALAEENRRAQEKAVVVARPFRVEEWD